MKNLHIIPTDKPSRLWTNNLRRRIELDEFPEQHPNQIAKHIYITSDEEIKEGDWVYNIVSKNIFKASKQLIDLINDPNVTLTTNKKIILTTDPQLIKDGVQSIDDEFLEWFVNNPSCEEVDVQRGYLGMGGFVQTNEPISKDKVEYLIIIPKPKQETYKKD